MRITIQTLKYYILKWIYYSSATALLHGMLYSPYNDDEFFSFYLDDKLKRVYMSLFFVIWIVSIYYLDKHNAKGKESRNEILTNNS